MTGSFENTGEHFGPFRIFEQLGTGGSASVSRATRRCEDGSELEVSLKRLHPHLADDKDAVRLFVNEAEIASVLHHDNICRFYELGRLGDQLFISMEYIAGVDLRRLLQEAHNSGRPPPFAVTLSLLVQLCDALEYAHNRVDDESGVQLDLVHRDISPSNLIVTRDGRLKLIDLGIAKSRTTDIHTATGLIRGKFGYMAPEVLRGGRADQRSDIYGVGVVAWELLTANRLFGGANDADTLERVRQGANDPPSSKNPACAPQLDAIVMRALSSAPDERWPTAAALRTALQTAAALLHEPVSPDIVRKWLTDALSIPLAAPPSDSEATTNTLSMDDPTPPAPAPAGLTRFARGSAQVPSIGLHSDRPESAAPNQRIDVTTAPVQPRPLVNPKRRPGMFGMQPRPGIQWLTAASLILNVLLVIVVVATAGDTPGSDVVPTGSLAAPPVPPAVPSAAVPSAAVPSAAVPSAEPSAAVPSAEPSAKPSAVPSIKRPNAPEIPHVAAAIELQRPPMRRYGRHPRSRSTRAWYRARLCVDHRGRVTSVHVTSGPPHLHRRIRRYLSHWRYKPPRVGGPPATACFDIRNRLRPWR